MNSANPSPPPSHHPDSRKEGDQGNAAYWYSRAGKPVCREPLDAEWLSIAKKLLR